jgi:hypothetical protein
MTMTLRRDGYRSIRNGVPVAVRLRYHLPPATTPSADPSERLPGIFRVEAIGGGHAVSGVELVGTSAR